MQPEDHPAEDLPPDDGAPGPLVEIGRYRRLNDARERGLVVAAMELPHWIERRGRGYVLMVEETAREQAATAVADFDRDERAGVQSPVLEPLDIPKFAVIAVLAAMFVFHRLQVVAPLPLLEAGVAANGAIRAGEWWRVFTALTLHGGVEHLVSNMSLAVFVFSFVFWRFGTGAGLLGVVLGGALGNLLNAFAHVAVVHRSIGSSTALFAGLGLLAGGEVAARLMRRETRTGWHLLVPLGAGLAFLALFGGGGSNRDGTPASGTGNVDVMAHLFGLLAGVILGALLFAAGLRRGTRSGVQVACGAAAAGMLALAWFLAARVL